MLKILRKKTASLFDRVLDFGMILGCISIFILMLIVCYDVIARYFFNAPSTWVFEISGDLLQFLPFLAGGWIMRQGGHVKMDLVLNMVRPRTKFVFNVAALIITACTCVILVYYGFGCTMEVYTLNLKTDTILRLPKWPLLVIIPLGFLTIFIQAIRILFDLVLNRNAGNT